MELQKKTVRLQEGRVGNDYSAFGYYRVVFSVALFVYSSFRILNQITLELDALNAVNFQFIGFRS